MAAGQRAMATDPALALTHFQAAAQLAPGRPEPRTKMGDCEMRRGNASAAASQYQAALNAFPSYGPAIIGLARAHARLGHDADARDLYRKYLDVNRTGTNADEARRVLGETAP
jgi:Tfp pilus assembly protein PilF